METIRLYLLFVISLAGMILCDDSFSPEKKEQFLKYIFKLHYSNQLEHNLPAIQRTEIMDNKAYELLFDNMFENKPIDSNQYTVKYVVKQRNTNTILNDTLADIIYAEICSQITWDMATYIGLAIVRTPSKYGVLVLYFPRISNDPSLSVQSASDYSKPSTYDQGGSSTI